MVRELSSVELLEAEVSELCASLPDGPIKVHLDVVLSGMRNILHAQRVLLVDVALACSSRRELRQWLKAIKKFIPGSLHMMFGIGVSAEEAYMAIVSELVSRGYSVTSR